MLTNKDHKTIITLSRAGLNNQMVRIEYEYLNPRRGGRTVFLKPSHFVHGVRGQADKLHIVGFDVEEEGIRQLAVSNIVSVKTMRGKKWA